MALTQKTKDALNIACAGTEAGEELSAAIDAAASIEASEIADDAITNAKINSSAAIAFSKLASLTSARILVGNGSNVATSVALSGDATLSNTGALTIANGAITRTKQSTASASKCLVIPSGTIATTGDMDTYVIAPEAGSLTSVDFYGLDALAANNSNYITFTVTNLGQSNVGTTVMLEAVDSNTTKASGGSAIAAHTKRSLVVNSTPANLVVF